MPHFFITTAIDYTNAAPHIGHAYEKVLADVLARYHRLKGDDVFYLTGVDQHGQKVQQSADKQGIPPQEFVDGVTKKFVALWDKLDVRYDDWAATTDAKHKDCVRANLQMLWDDKVPGTDRSRWIYKKTQRGYYSVRQEQFLTDKERNDQGEFGPEWQPVEEREEENFYFRLTAHSDLGFDPKQWLLDFIDQRSAEGRPFVVPDFRVAELRNAVEKLEGDLCISRPASRLKWGIPFPESFGEGFVTYVWFDALVNYITYAPGHDPHFAERMKDEGGRMKRRDTSGSESTPAAEGPSSSSFIPPPSSFADWWPPVHVIGKDIMIPAHGVYWPIMLKALGFADEEMPTLLVHGWWNIAGAKMSKSLGNVVDPDVLADKYGAEIVRYYLMRGIKTGRDADFDEDWLVKFYGSDLANNIGNLLNRSLSMALKYREGRIAKIAKHDSIAFVVDQCEESVSNYSQWMDKCSVDAGMVAADYFASKCNELVQLTSPWVLAKAVGDVEKQACLDAVLYALAESLRIIAILISPVLPKAAHGIFDQLQWKLADSGRSQRFHLEDAKWGGLPDGHVLGKPTPLFPRIEPPAV